MTIEKADKIVRDPLYFGTMKELKVQMMRVAATDANVLITGENFVGDLVGGTYSNGSDERDYADQWFERAVQGTQDCRFQ